MNLESLKKVVGIGKATPKEQVGEQELTFAEGATHKITKPKEQDKYAIDNFEQDSVSFVEGEKSTIKGVKRPVVLGIGAIFITTFIIGMFYGVSSNDKPKQAKQEETTAAVSDSTIDSMTPTEEQVSRLAQYNQQNKGNKGNGQNQTLRLEEAKKLQQANKITGSQQTNADLTTRDNNASYTTTQYRQLPIIPQQRYSTFPYAAFQMQPPVAPAENTNDDNVVEKVKDTFDSAIAFAMGNKINNNNLTGSTSVNMDNAALTTTSSSSSNYSSVGTMNYIPVSSSMIQAGTLIPAILITGVNTDAGGMVQAQITSDVYDSLSGSTLLIPAGSRLLGNYTAGANGRINIDWQTLIIQDYGSWNLDGSMVAVDNMGYAGLKGHVNNHAGKVLTAGSIATGLAAVAGIAGGNTNVSNNNYSYGQLASQGAMSNFLNTASAFFQKSIDTAETITIDPGYQFNVFVTQAISF